jgi:hypothetical protein
MNTRWPRVSKSLAGGVRDRSQAAADVTTITLSYTFFEVGGKVPGQGPVEVGKPAPGAA